MIFYCVIGVESRDIYDYYDLYDDALEFMHELVYIDYYLDDLEEDLTILRVDSPYCGNDPEFFDYLKECARKAVILL